MSNSAPSSEPVYGGFDLALEPPAPRATRMRAVRSADDGAGYIPRTPGAYESDRTRIDTNGVRTVRIRGQVTPARRRPAIALNRYGLSRYDRHPDRAAQWALFLGVFMVVVAIITGS